MKRELIILFLSFCSMFCLAQTPEDIDIENRIEVLERYYDDGDYEKGVSKTSKNIKKYTNKGYLAMRFQPLLAKYQQAYGDFLAFDKTISKYIKNKKNAGETSESYARGLLEVALLYSEYGNPILAEKYLKNAKNLLASKAESGDIAEKAKAVQARIYFQNGAWKLFIEAASELANETNFEKNISYFDEAQLIAYERPAKAREIKRRKEKTAEWQILIAEAQRKLGEFEAAEKSLEKAKALFGAEINNKNATFTLYEQIEILLMIEQGKNRESIRKKMENALFFGERTIGLVHKNYLDLQHQLISYYNDSQFAQEGEKTKFAPYKLYLEARYPIKNRKHRYELRKNTNRYFGKDNFHFGYARLFDALRGQQALDFRGAEKIIADLHKNTVVFPLNHPARRELLLLMFKNKISLDKFADAEKVLTELNSHAKEVFSENSFAMNENALLEVNYLANYTNRFSYADSLLKNFEANTKAYSPSSEFSLRGISLKSDLFEFQGELDKSIETQKVLLDRLKMRFDTLHVRFTVEKQKLLQLQMRKGNYDNLDKNIETVLAVYDREKNPNFNAYHAEALEIAAQYYATMGLFSQAQNSLLIANRKFNKTSVGTGNSTANDELAKLYVQMGRYFEAEKIIKQTIETREKRFGADNRFLITPYREIANLQMTFYGNYVEADNYINKALQISNKTYGEQSVSSAECLAVMAKMANAIGDFSRSAEFLEKAIEIKAKAFGEKNLDLATNYLDLAVSKFNSKEKQAVVDALLEKSLTSISANIGIENPIYAQALLNSAKVFLKEGQKQRAKNNLFEAKKIWDKIETKKGINKWEVNQELALVLIEEAEFAEAEKLLLLTSQNFKKIFGDHHPKYVETLSDLAKLEFIRNNPTASFKYIDEVLSNYKTYIKESFPALSDREKSNYWSLIREKFEFYNNLVFKFAAKDNERIGSLFDNAMLTKTLLLSASIKVRSAILNSKNDSLISNYNLWLNKQDQYSKVLGMSQEQRKQENLDPQKLKKEIENLNKILSRQSEAFVSAEQSIYWKQVQTVLKNNEVAVEMVRFRYFDVKFTDSVLYAALILPQTQNLQFVIIPNGKFLETQALTYYKNFTSYKRVDLLSYKAFWADIDNVISDNAKIFFSPDGAYTQINLEGMLYNETEYLIDKNQINLIGSAQDLVLQTSINKSVASNEFILIGNPKFYKAVSEDDIFKIRKQIPQLKGAEDEIIELSKILDDSGIKKRVFLRTVATEDTLRLLKSPRVFHIATHGFFEAQRTQNSNSLNLNENATYDNPLLRSGLLLTEAGDLMQTKNYFEYNRSAGVLTAYEVANLNFDNTELVILSACETGKGDVKEGDGVFGLQRAFFVAGAKSLIMSLFKVDDEATKRLMVLFYQHWLKSGDKRAAFDLAKKELRKEFAHPYYWASFIMLGI